MILTSPLKYAIAGFNCIKFAIFVISLAQQLLYCCFVLFVRSSSYWFLSMTLLNWLQTCSTTSIGYGIAGRRRVKQRGRKTITRAATFARTSPTPPVPVCKSSLSLLNRSCSQVTFWRKAGSLHFRCAILFFFSGHYMFVEASLPRRQGDLARFISPISYTPHKLCLQFW